MGTGDVRRDRGQRPDSEGDPGRPPWTAALLPVVDHDDRRDDEHPVDGQRDDVGDLRALAGP